MSNRNRKRLLLKPKSSTERAIRSRYSAGVIALTFCGQWLAFWSTTSVGAKSGNGLVPNCCWARRASFTLTTT